MKHSLQLRLSQHLTLTPQLQQSIRLLQLSTLELSQELERILQENPLLEREEVAREQPAPPQDATQVSEPAPAQEATPPDTAGSESDAGELGTENNDFSALDDAPSSGYREDGEDGEYPQV